MSTSGAGTGVVAAGHAAVADAAITVLRAGGNAFDACVAAGFAAAVAEPGFTGLGGGGFLLAHTAGGDDVLFDFFVDTPGRGLPQGERVPHFEPVVVRFSSTTQVFHAGLGSAAVPGCLAGYRHVHRALGVLPLDEVLAPAIELARNGVDVNPSQGVVFGLLETILLMTPDGQRVFAPHGRLLREGDQIVNVDLARFLEAVAAGEPDSDLYRGPHASRIAADMADGDGLLTEADLAAYEVVERTPLAVSYRGRTVLTNPPPSFGGALIGLALELLEQRGALPARHTPDHVLALTDVQIEVDRLRAAAVSRGTTHVSVADGLGNVASMTTSNGECSGYVVPGTGVLLNNMLGEDDLHPNGFHAANPGSRVPSMMAPSLVLDETGQPCLVLGSGGSKRIRSAILQVLSGVIDHGCSIADAVTSPRLHWDGDSVQVEPGLPADAVAALRGRYAVNQWTSPDLYFGGVHAVVPGGGGAGDPRRSGAARSA